MILDVCHLITLNYNVVVAIKVPPMNKDTIIQETQKTF